MIVQFPIKASQSLEVMSDSIVMNISVAKITTL